MASPGVLGLLNIGIRLLIHDTFSGSGNVDGRTPDTKQVGSNVWHYMGWGGAGNLTVSSGFLVCDTNVESCRIDCGETDVHIIGSFITEEFPSGLADCHLLARITSTDDNGLPDDGVRIGVENDSELIVIFDRVGGSDTITSLAYIPQFETLFDVEMSVIGDVVKVKVGDVVLTATTENLSGENVGVGVRFSTSTQNSKCADFKVYTASGVIIDV